MEAELRARAASPPAKERDTPPPSPAAAAGGGSPAEDAPLLPGVRRRAMRERFAQRSGSFRRDVGRAAAETFLLTRLTLTLLRYLGYAPVPFPLAASAFVQLPPVP
jgi:prenylcysteine alpha-carboxyl methylesterase